MPSSSHIVAFVLGIVAAIGVGGLLAGAGSTVAGPSMTPEEVVGTWLDAAQIGDVESMLALTAASTKPALERDRVRLVRLVNHETAPLIRVEDFREDDGLSMRPSRAGGPMPPMDDLDRQLAAEQDEAEAENTTAAADTPSVGRFTYEILADRSRTDEGNAIVVVRLERRGREVLREYTLTQDDTGEWRVLSWQNARQQG